MVMQYCSTYQEAVKWWPEALLGDWRKELGMEMKVSLFFGPVVRQTLILDAPRELADEAFDIAYDALMERAMTFRESFRREAECEADLAI